MKQEMRKLNRAKYACSEDEVKRLTAEGYVPVGKKAASGQDTEQQAAAGKKDKKPKKQAAEPDQKDSGAEQQAAGPDQEDDKAGQQAADEDGNKK